MSEYYPFFVYGTLRPSQPNFYLWEDKIVRMEEARLSHSVLYDLGAYPILRLVERADAEVLGHLIWVDPQAYERIMGNLDQLEGLDGAQPNSGFYSRTLSQPMRADESQVVEAWVYRAVADQFVHCPIIEHGDWVAYVQRKQDEVDHIWRTLGITPPEL